MVKIHQDVGIYVSELDQDKSLAFTIKENHQLYFVQIEGSSLVNDIQLHFGDALKIQDEKQLNIKALSHSHFLFIEMPKA